MIIGKQLMRTLIVFIILLLAGSNLTFVTWHDQDLNESVSGSYKERHDVPLHPSQCRRSEARGGSDNWTMFGHDLNHTSSTGAQPPLFPHLLWSFDMKDMPTAAEGDVYSTPLIMGDSVYACSNNFYMVSIDIDDGSENWHTYLENTIKSTPTYHDGHLYVGAGNYLWEVDADTGGKNRTFTAGAEIVSSPAIYNDTLFFATMFSDSKLHAVAMNGTELWNNSMNGSLQGTPGSPAIHNGTVYIGSDSGMVYALDHDGLLDGNQGPETGENNTTADIIWKKDLAKSILASPTVIPGAVVFSTSNMSGPNRVYALGSDTGDEIWNYTLNDRIRSTAAYDAPSGRLYLGTFGGHLLALDASSGGLVWSFDTDGNAIQSSPTLAGDAVFFGGFDRKIWALDAVGNGDGTTDELWNYTTGEIIHSSPSISSGRLFVGSDDDHLYCIGAPDFEISNQDIGFSDVSPYLGEEITISVNVSNRGTVASSVDVKLMASNLNNSIQHDIGTRSVYVGEMSRSNFNFHWVVEHNDNNTWNIWVELDNSDLNEDNIGNNLATRSLTFKRDLLDEWPMTGGDPAHWSYNPKGTLTNRTLWEKEYPGTLLPPIIYNERAIIVDTSGRVTSSYLNLDGATSWEISLGSIADFPPAAAYGKVFVPLRDRIVALDVNGFEDGNQGILTESGTDIGDGDIYWETLLPYPVSAPPTVENGTLFLLSDSHLLIMDEDDGEILHNITVPTAAGISAPTVHDEFVSVGGVDGKVFTYYRMNGTLAWVYDTGPSLPLNQSFTVMGRRMFIPSGTQLIAIDMDSQALDWSLPVTNPISTSTAYSPLTDSLYFGTSGGKLYMVSPDGGHILMTYTVPSAISTDISLGGDVAYFATGEGAVYAVSNDSGSQDGKLRWFHETGETITPSIAVAGLVLVTTEEGVAYCFGAPNTLPVARIGFPVANTSFFVGEEVELNASYSSDGDGDSLLYIWSSDKEEEELYRGRSFSASVSFRKAGPHNCTLTVNDGQGGVGTAWVNIMVYDRRYLHYEITDPEINASATLDAMVGGDDPSFNVNFTGNPSNLTGRDIGIFLNVTTKAIRLFGWMNVTITYGESGLLYGLNQSYLSVFDLDSNGKWVKIPTSLDVIKNTAWINVSQTLRTHFAPNSSMLSLGTFDNNNPALASPSVTPMSGPKDGMFNFSVTYMDTDGDFPESIVVVLDGNHSYHMRPSSPKDLDVRDGKDYYYLLQGLEVGNHSFSFEANDRIMGIKTEVLEGLVGKETRPDAFIASPGNGITFKVGEVVTLDATGSVDPDGDRLNYTWSIWMVEGGADIINISKNTTADLVTTFEFSIPGLYRISLIAADGYGHESVPLNISVTIEEAPEPDGETSDRSGLVYFSVIGILLILVVIVILILMRKRKKEAAEEEKEEETTVDVESDPPESTDEAEGGEERDDEEQENGKPEEVPEAEELECINCGASVSSSDLECPECQEELGTEGVHEPEEDGKEIKSVDLEEELEKEIAEEIEAEEVDDEGGSLEDEDLLDEDDLLDESEDRLLDEE